MRWAESCKGSMLFDVGPFEVGHVVSVGCKVAVELAFIGRGYNVFEDGVNEGPEVSWVFRGSLEELLCPDCKVWVVLSTEESTKAV